MVRKPTVSSRHLVAAFVAAAFSVSTGAALAHATTPTGQDQATASSSSATQGGTNGTRSSLPSRVKSDIATRESITQLTDELKQEDKEMRQANAQLKRANERLARTRRELRRAQSEEEHVASAEHRTAKGEREEGQSAARSEQGNAPAQGTQSSSNPNSGTPR
jgi:hypothetical protein